MISIYFGKSKERSGIMGGKVKKSEFDPDITLVDLIFLLKGRQKIMITTSVAECTDFVDWWNNNSAFKFYDKVTKDKFNNKFYTFNDYKNRESVSINVNEIKAFKVPFYLDKGVDEVEFKYLVIQ